MSHAFDILGLTNKGPLGGDLDGAAGKREYRNSPLNAPVDAGTGLPGLHRFNDTSAPGLRDEKAWHRMAAYMLLAHRTNAEVGMAAGVSADEVGCLRAQRWFQELLATLANENGQDILALIKSEAAASVEKLVTLRDTAESEGVQLKASLALIEHAVGKPTQTIFASTSGPRYASPEEELAAVQDDLRRLRESREVPALTPPAPTAQP